MIQQKEFQRPFVVSYVLARICRHDADIALPYDCPAVENMHDDVIKWKQFPRHWPFVRGIHRSLVNSPHKGQWRGALMFSLICPWTNDWVNNQVSSDLRYHHAHYDVTVMDNEGCILIWKMYIIVSGVEILNSASEKVYAQVPPEKWVFVNVAVAPSTITISEYGVSLWTQFQW